MIIQGDCLEKLKELQDESIDAIVTDPPYELGFMGKKWDNSGIAYNVDLWRECLRVLKPGGHLLAFGGTRTYHRMAVAIEDAGFEVRDMLEWIYASGFPKSLNVGKAVKAKELTGGSSPKNLRQSRMGNNYEPTGQEDYRKGRMFSAEIENDNTKEEINNKWEGFGTALKPAHEPIIMARKPLSEKTIVENVLKHGTGAIDIDGCRIPLDKNAHKDMGTFRNAYKQGAKYDGTNGNVKFGGKELVADVEKAEMGRFPANIICTDDALNDGSYTKDAGIGGRGKYGRGDGYGFKPTGQVDTEKITTGGSKSRYFDIDVWAEKHGLLQFPKASKRERNEGCEGLEAKENSGSYKFREDGSLDGKPTEAKSNFHPTVKPVHLMSWLVRLVSKKGDIVLDPFMGSGTTGVACKKLDRDFIGIEISPEYCKIAEQRLRQQILI